MTATYRPKSDRVDDAFEEIREEFKDQTNNQEYGKNAALNYAIILAKQKLDELNGQVKSGKRQKLEAADAVRGN